MVKEAMNAVKLGLHMVKLFELFRRADRKKMDAANKAKDLKKQCEALGVTEKELKTLLSQGEKLSRNLSKSDLEKALSVFRKSIKK